MIKVEFEAVAKALFKANVLQENGNFILSSGEVTHKYWDFSELKGYPIHKRVIVDAYLQMIQNLGFDSLADVPNTPGFLVSSLCDKLFVPQITPRIALKDHGNIREIEGPYKKGDKIILLEDVFTTGNSAMRHAEKIEMFDMEVVGIFGIIDYERGAAETLSRWNWAAFTTNNRLINYREMSLQKNAEVPKM